MKKEKKWKTLQHNGILFPPEFETKNIKIKLKGKEIKINLFQEEMVYQWAKKKDTPYVQDSVFQKNFTNDFAKTLPVNLKNIKYSDIDFSRAYRVVDKEKDAKDLMTKEERKEIATKRKNIREKMKSEYGIAIIDGKETDIANYMAEPPGIFIGRGQHPLRGKWKVRITKKDVVLNLGKNSKIPKGDWKKIEHNQEATWLAYWIDSLTKSHKYIWLADVADFKQDKDKSKYNKAVNLSKSIKNIEKHMIKDMTSKDNTKRTIATICFLIYTTAMRVGDEKDPEEADTVGATTLRTEHIKITPDGILFDFLGKDSIRWKEEIKKNDKNNQLYTNLKKIIKDKKPKEEIFGNITSRQVNKYYSSILEGLSAKVFRTYLASKVVAKSLSMNKNVSSESAAKKLYLAKISNLEAAIMCNHKRTIPKTFAKSLQKKKDTLKKIKNSNTWRKAEISLQAAKNSKPKSTKQKTAKVSRIHKAKMMIKKRKEKHAERLEKAQLQISLTEKTMDYNIGTSLRNYIDPRIFKSWSSEVDMQWEKLYTSALQKKFLWVKEEKGKWDKVSGLYLSDK
ncbi:MAG: DNA topoisomerase I [Candidatus Nitrosoabyssus spongiisocia]|nr:MAG: DNA topoisomerase I [Nitrosopumilaceae archaeon AB1(1)]